MRFIIGFLSGVLGALAGWAGLAFLVVSLAGPDRDGGIAMGAFFNIGPVGGLIGFAAGVALFVKFGMVARAAPAQTESAQAESVAAASVTEAAASSEAQQSDTPTSTPARTRVSPFFAVAVVAVVAGLAWWGWYELIRSPYLTRGYMTLHLQFKLPPGMALPADSSDVHALVDEAGQHSEVLLGRAWHGTVGDQRVILATSSLSLKTRHRVVHFEMPGVPEQTWQIDLPNDPDPTPGYSPWRLASGFSPIKIEMNFSLTADH